MLTSIAYSISALKLIKNFIMPNTAQYLLTKPKSTKIYKRIDFSLKITNGNILFIRIHTTYVYTVYLPRNLYVYNAT